MRRIFVPRRRGGSALARAKDVTCPLLDYVQNLEKSYGTHIHVGYLSNWFKMWWQFRVSLCNKASLIPYDKCIPENIAPFLILGGHADIVEDLLWTSVVNGVPPLHVVILYLPTHSPELNPI
jgi:hypothetical protein